MPKMEALTAARTQTNRVATRGASPVQLLWPLPARVEEAAWGLE